MRTHVKGLLALSPLLFFVAVYAGTSVAVGDFYKVPISIMFLLTAAYAIAFVGSGRTADRIKTFSRGAGQSDIMLMVWIFAMAGAFSHVARGMGSVDSTVNLILSFLPASMVLPGLFVATCIVSFSIGTSVGTIAALVPIAAGIAQSTGLDVPLVVGTVVGGAFFGDNLSFISDTTVVATSAQGCTMRDKFRVNAFITVPAALAVLVLYILIGSGMEGQLTVGEWHLAKILPYVVVIVAALSGLHVLIVLTLGIVVAAFIGILSGDYTLVGAMAQAADGMGDMGELILISMLAGGILEVINRAGGIQYLINSIANRISKKRNAELSVGLLVSVVDLCTANNTIAILTVGNMAKQIAQRFGIDRRKCASILDTFSCCMQGLLPYGAQLLMAGGLAAISPMQIIPNLYYTFILLLSVVLSIYLRYPRRYS